MARFVIPCALLRYPALLTLAFSTWNAWGFASDTVTEEDRRFWSFRVAERPVLPVVQSTNRIRTPIDAFVLARLEGKGGGFAADANPHTLIRRLSLDLTGLGPTPEDVEAFLADGAPGAYERVVDRLLASPRFGERWGRHWLDVAGYVDTVGFDVDADLIITSEGKWRYRDYVIRAWNEDKPYDRFLAEQLAGDELCDWRQAQKLTPNMQELLVATGYLRTAADFTHEDVGNIPQNYFNVLNDTLEIVGTSALGLTLQCARCHSHKFDPIPHDDYYRLMALFTPAYNPSDWKVVIPYEPKVKDKDRALPDMSATDKAELDRRNVEIDHEVAALDSRLSELRRPYREQVFARKLAALPEPIRADTRKALETPANMRNEVQKYLAGKFEASLKITPEETDATLSATDKTAAAGIQDEIKAHQAKRGTWRKLQALYDLGPPPPTHRLVRGNHTTPGPEVPPGFLRVLCAPGSPETVTDAAPPYPGTSGRRLALARWLTTENTPAASLTARVMANRVWQHLLGEGIVTSPENFGMAGEPPSHPELLEWLSAEFMSNGWRVKSLIRSIVTSTVYRQSSRDDDAPGAVALDPENHLLGRMRLKRLESEAVRDAILAASGALDSTMGGPPIMLEWRSDGSVVIAEKVLPSPSAKGRRSVYLLARRAFHVSLMNVFDQPIMATNCPRRDQSAVPLQSLAMLNGPFVFEQAELLAGRIGADGEICPRKAIAAAFALVLGRPPTLAESSWCLELSRRQARLYRATGLAEPDAERQALVHVCHTLFNTTEFLYSP